MILSSLLKWTNSGFKALATPPGAQGTCRLNVWYDLGEREKPSHSLITFVPSSISRRLSSFRLILNGAIDVSI